MSAGESASLWANMWRRRRRGWPYTLLAVSGALAIWHVRPASWSPWLTLGVCVVFGLAVGLVEYLHLHR